MSRCRLPWLTARCLCPQKKPGEKGYMRPIVVDGEERIFSPEMLTGLLLEMATGSSRTPKGGLAAVAKASDKGKAAPSTSGKFGEGAYKDEPWGIVAMRKRIYGVRAFYASVFHGVEGAREKNPAWNEIVTNTLNMLAQLLGTKAQHVPKALKKEQIASLVGAVRST